MRTLATRQDSAQSALLWLLQSAQVPVFICVPQIGSTVLLVGVLAPGCARSFCDVLFFLSFHSFSVVSLASGLDVLADPFHVYEITMLDALLLLHHFAIFHGSSFLFGCFRLVPSSHLQDSCSRCLDASAGLICHLESGCPVQRSRFCFYCFYWLCFYLACQKCQLPCNLCLLTCFGEFFLVLRCPYLCSVLDLFQYPLLASFAFFKSLLRRLVLRRWEGIVIITPLPLPPA